MGDEKLGGRRDLLWVFLFLIVFINGFEAGGYQASLYTIGQTYDLSIMNMGIFASVELFATMLAPLILGRWADRTDKIKCIEILLCIQVLFAFLIFCSNLQMFFIIGIFFLGLTTSALQFISIAELAETYPISGKKKIGFMTSMYALGALVSPLFVNYYLNRGITWRTLFIALAIGSIIAISGVIFTKNFCLEKDMSCDDESVNGSTFIVTAILLLCVVMCIYVGFENGFAFFVDTLFTDVLKSSSGKFALSMYWAVMIPARILVGCFSKHARKILLTALIAIPVVSVVIAMLSNAGLVIALIVPLGLASGAIYPCVLTIMLSYSGAKKATATAMITVSTGIGGVVFTALTGIFADFLGMRNALICLGAFFIFSITAMLILNSRRFNK